MTINFASSPSVEINSSIQRFDSRFFSLDFRYGCVATIDAIAADEMRVHCQFRSNLDLIGLFWKSKDTFGHPLLKYATDKNYTGCIRAFAANPVDPYNFSLTVVCGAKSYIYRLFPYKDVGGTLVADYTDAITQGTGTGRTYSTAALFPSGLTLSKDSKVFIVDYSNMYQGFAFDGARIPCDRIDSDFIAIVDDSYGIGVTATLDNAVNANLTTWNISGVSPNFRVQAGDVITVTYTQGSSYIAQDVVVTTFTRPTSTTLHLTMATPLNVVTWTGGKVTAKSLSLDSPVGDVSFDFYIYNVSITGSRTTVGRYYYPQPAHSIKMATGYDDTYNITPWRQANQIYDLGYRGDVVCYMGASHYFQSSSSLIGGAYYNKLNTAAATPLNAPTVAWCTSFFSQLHTLGLGFVWSTSLEILSSAMPNDWVQKDYLGTEGTTGYTPTTSFMSPGNSDVKDYVIAVIKQGLGLMQTAGLALKFQLGEFWYWDGSYTNLRPCIYDNALKNLYFTETGNYAPQDPISPPSNNSYIYNSNQTLTTNQRAYANWLGAQLGKFTKAISDSVKATYTSAQSTLLFFSPQIFATASTLLPIINFPSAYWKYSTGTYDYMQIEDYDWIIFGQLGRLPLTLQAATGTGTLPSGQDELGYPINLVDYFIGFVPQGNDAVPPGATAGQTGSLEIWDYCSIALNQAIDNGITTNRVWAYPQVVRDGIVISNQAFIDPLFPVGQSFFCLPKPEFDTIISASEGELETRVNALGGLARYEFTLQSRSIIPSSTATVDGDFKELMAFAICLIQGQNQNFRTKKGVFRLNCQSDNSGINEVIGIGDNSTLTFTLKKTYSYDGNTYTRYITKPNAQPVIYFDGVVQSSGWYCDLFSGVVSFQYPPANDIVITADYTFDFPVRFYDDSLPFSLDVLFNSPGFDDLVFVEEMELINSAQSDFNTTIESRFPVSQSYMSIGKPVSKSSFTNSESGKTTRFTSVGDKLLYEFTLEARAILPVDTGTSLGDFNKMIAFFLCIAQGSLNAFRFKYSQDYSMTNQLIGVGDGVKTTFQIIKTYNSGSLNYTRTIKKPVAGTITITFSSGSYANTIDSSTGIITFSSPPANGVLIYCTCEYDYLVRFKESKFHSTIDMDYGFYGMDDLILLEVRE